MADETINVWDCGDEYSNRIRRLVNDEVHRALKEYVKEGSIFSISYRKGGTPIIYFELFSDALDAPIVIRQHDLADILLSALRQCEEVGPGQMEDLLRALLETYAIWRNRRIADDPNCSIPEPKLIDDEENQST
jgi:hypothetical protein